MTIAFENFSALKAGIADYLAEGDSVEDDVLSLFVRLCEATLRDDLRLLTQEITDDSLSITEETLTAPTGFLKARLLVIPGNKPMNYLDASELAVSQAERRNGQPDSFTIEGRATGLPLFRFSPLPSGTHALRLIYTKDLALVDEQDNNVILSAHPDLYLYGSLIHSGAYFQNKERMPTWEKLYADAAARAKARDKSDRYSGSRLRVRSGIRPA